MTDSTPEATADPSSKNEALSGTYVPSASEWVRAQVETYERTGGQEANTLLDTGIPVIIVTMRGAKTGDVRKIALMRVEHARRLRAGRLRRRRPEAPRLVLEPHGPPR